MNYLVGLGRLEYVFEFRVQVDRGQGGCVGCRVRDRPRVSWELFGFARGRRERFYYLEEGRSRSERWPGRKNIPIASSVDQRW